MMDSSAVWSGQDPTLSVSSQDDFQQFLDMGINGLGESLQFDFQEFQSQPQGSQMMHGDSGETMDSRMDARVDNDRGGMVHKDTIMQDHISSMATAASHPSIQSAPLIHGQSSSDSLLEIDAQIQYLQQQRHQQQQRQIQEQQRNYYAHTRPIPPTPNSADMHGGHFYRQSDSQQQAMYERYQMHVKEQEVCL